MEITALQVKDELARIDRRVGQLERLNLGDATAALRTSISELGVKVIEAETVRTKQLVGLKKGLLDLSTHIARSNVDQRIAQLDKRVSELDRSGDRALFAQKLSDELARLARRLDIAEDTYGQDLARLKERLNSAQPQTPVSSPAKAGHPEFDLPALTKAHHQSEPGSALTEAAPHSSSHETLPLPRHGIACSDFASVGQQPAPKKEQAGMRHQRTPVSAADRASEKIRLRNIAITSVTVLLLALAAAYFLYHGRALAAPFPLQQHHMPTKAQAAPKAPSVGK